MSLQFGEEFIASEDVAPPRVVMVPRGGPFVEPGYAQNQDAENEDSAGNKESIDFYVFGYSKIRAAQPVDHADEAESVLQLLLQAFWYQRPNGLTVSLVSGRWHEGIDVNVYGRVYVITAQFEKTINGVDPANAIATTVTTTTSISSS